MSKPLIIAGILSARHPSRWHYREIARAQFLPQCPFEYKFVIGRGENEVEASSDILLVDCDDRKKYLHEKNQAFFCYALDHGADFVWRCMDDTWWFGDRIAEAGLEAYDVAGNFPCRLKLGGTFSIPFRYWTMAHGGTGIWLSRKAMKMIVDTKWDEHYYDSWPDELDIGFGLTLPKPEWLWDDNFISEALQGCLAWDDPLRNDPWAAYVARGLSVLDDELLFENPDPSRPLALHDPGRTKPNAGRFDDMMRQVKRKNVAAAEAARAQEESTHV